MEIRTSPVNGKIANITHEGWILLMDQEGAGLPNCNHTVLIATNKGFIGTGSVVQKRPEVLWNIDCSDKVDPEDFVIAFRYLPNPPNLLKGFVCTHKEMEKDA